MLSTIIIFFLLLKAGRLKENKAEKIKSEILLQQILLFKWGLQAHMKMIKMESEKF
jgi:hypothetical protein